MEGREESVDKGGSEGVKEGGEVLHYYEMSRQRKWGRGRE